MKNLSQEWLAELPAMTVLLLTYAETIEAVSSTTSSFMISSNALLLDATTDAFAASAAPFL